jgi:hypothetical protein
MNLLYWYIPLHLVMGSLGACLMWRYFLKEEGKIVLPNLMICAACFVIWPSGILIGLMLSIEELVIYRRKD